MKPLPLPKKRRGRRKDNPLIAICKMQAASLRPRLGSATTQQIEAIQREGRAAYQQWYQRGLAQGEVNPAIAPDFAALYIDTQLALALTLMG